MTNYEWMKGLSISELAEVMFNSNNIYDEYEGHPVRALKRWLRGERIECPYSECYYRHSLRCKTCWGSTLVNIFEGCEGCKRGSYCVMACEDSGCMYYEGNNLG